MRLEMGQLIDVTEYESLARIEASKRFDRAQRNGDENNFDVNVAWARHLRGVAAEVAARLQLGIDPFGIQDDALGRPDIVLNGLTIDVKCITIERPKLSVKYYDGILDRRSDWLIMVMQYEGVGWRFKHKADIEYRSLAYLPLNEPRNHTSRYWEIDLGTKKSDTR